MMNMLEEAIIYATVMHQGKIRKFNGNPYILHPMEVAQILSTVTEDAEIITAGILHDIVEDTDGTLAEIEKRFGKRVAMLVSSESENQYPEEDRSASWKRRKEESLLLLKNSEDIGVKMLWLADKLANIRSLARVYSETGEAMWEMLHEHDPALHCWYYKTVAETVELSLNKTGAFKEFIKHINFIWPGTYDSEKARYRKYREFSVDGCQQIGRGAKGDVYRFDDELVIKVFNQNNTYHDVEQEIALSRKAFLLGVPTAISFGIVAVGDRYGAMYELVESETLSQRIARDPGQADFFAGIMADLAHTIHGIAVTEDDGFPSVTERYQGYVLNALQYDHEELAGRCLRLVKTMALPDHLVHGDFHTGNVFFQKGEPLLIDMDRISVGHPIAEISDLYYFYVVLGEDDPAVVSEFMGFSYQTALQFFDSFLKKYLNTEDENILQAVTEKARFLCNIRTIHRLMKKQHRSPAEQKKIDRCLQSADELAGRLETLAF